MWSQLAVTCEQIGWASPQGRRRATITALRLIIHRDYDRLEQLTDTDLRIPERGANGTMGDEVEASAERVRRTHHPQR